MRLLATLLLFCLLVARPVRAQDVSVLDERFDVAAGGRLDVRVGDADVRLMPGPAFSFEGRLGEDAAEGRLTGGGPPLDVQAGDGPIPLQEG